MDKEEVLYKLKQKCQNKNYRKLSEIEQRSSNYQNEDLVYNMEQRTFLSFSTDLVCIIAFIFFGSVIFWFSIARFLVDCLRTTYHSDRCTKIFVSGLLTILFLSITTRVILNKMSWKHKLSQDKMQLTMKNNSGTSIPAKLVVPPKPEYLEVKIKDKNVRSRISENKTDVSIPKKFTVTIVDERKKEVFKTSRNFNLSGLTPEMNNKPSLIVSIKDILLENY
ncbi:uncharacterized protein LOC129948236 [Eupeodes corollae]|uniref:uncharacterized protein LOC129948236 n=1 Tax=Eupeodes corollae TaxID=290404 RepID=UPI0024923F1C|nr:uncharacterized protein LOC129948236 [Eupeodes corollae]